MRLGRRSTCIGAAHGVWKSLEREDEACRTTQTRTGTASTATAATTEPVHRSAEDGRGRTVTHGSRIPKERNAGCVTEPRPGRNLRGAATKGRSRQYEGGISSEP